MSRPLHSHKQSPPFYPSDRDLEVYQNSRFPSRSHDTTSTEALIQSQIESLRQKALSEDPRDHRLPSSRSEPISPDAASPKQGSPAESPAPGRSSESPPAPNRSRPLGDAANVPPYPGSSPSWGESWGEGPHWGGAVNERPAMSLQPPIHSVVAPHGLPSFPPKASGPLEGARIIGPAAGSYGASSGGLPGRDGPASARPYQAPPPDEDVISKVERFRALALKYTRNPESEAPSAPSTWMRLTITYKGREYELLQDELRRWEADRITTIPQAREFMIIWLMHHLKNDEVAYRYARHELTFRIVRTYGSDAPFTTIEPFQTILLRETHPRDSDQDAPAGSSVDLPKDIEQFLNDNGFQQYIPLFKEQDVDLEGLTLLTEADLKELGVKLVHAKMMGSKIEKYRNARLIAEQQALEEERKRKEKAKRKEEKAKRKAEKKQRKRRAKAERKALARAQLAEGDYLPDDYADAEYSGTPEERGEPKDRAATPARSRSPGPKRRPGEEITASDIVQLRAMGVPEKDLPKITAPASGQKERPTAAGDPDEEFADLMKAK